MAVGNNQMGPGGPGGGSYNPNKNQASVSYQSPGYTGSGSQSGNQGAGQSSSSAAPSADEIKNTESIKKRLQQGLNTIVNSQGQSGFETNNIAGQTISGQDKNGNNVSIVIPSNVPPKFHQFLINNNGTQAAASILNNYASSGVNSYQQEIEKFKNSPGGLAAFKKRFPNPLVKIAQGVGNYIKQGGALGILTNALGGSKKAASKFTQNASTMAKDLAGMFGLDALMAKNLGIAAGSDSEEVNKFIQGQQAYDPSGLEGYKDKIYRDLLNQERMLNNQGKKNSLDPYGVPNPAFGTDQFDPAAYNDMLVMDQLEKENEAKEEDPFGFNLTDQFSDTINLTGDPNEEIENVSETNYNVMKDFPKVTSYPYSTSEGFGQITADDTPGDFDLIDYARPIFGLEGTEGFSENISNTPALGQEINTFPGLEPDLSGFANGGYMSGFPNQNPAESLTASDNIDDRIMKNLQFEKMAPGMMGYNQGGKVMSTFEKLKAIADNNYG